MPINNILIVMKHIFISVYTCLGTKICVLLQNVFFSDKNLCFVTKCFSVTKLIIHHNNCGGQGFGQESRSFVTNWSLINVAQYFNNAENFSDQNQLFAPDTFSVAIL